jgi:hypothetical protein
MMRGQIKIDSPDLTSRFGRLVAVCRLGESYRLVMKETRHFEKCEVDEWERRRRGKLGREWERESLKVT